MAGARPSKLLSARVHGRQRKDDGEMEELTTKLTVGLSWPRDARSGAAAMETDGGARVSRRRRLEARGAALGCGKWSGGSGARVI